MAEGAGTHSCSGVRAFEVDGCTVGSMQDHHGARVFV